MRDVGFDFYWADDYSPNLLARGFEATRVEPPFCAVTAIEVLEHVYDPLEFVRICMVRADSRSIILTTALYGDSPPKPDWWYYARHTGQHVSFYQRRTLAILAQSLGLNFYSQGGIHILTDRKIATRVLRMATGRFASLLFAYVRTRMSSRVSTDHAAVF
jgi:hypothetical protein